MSRDVFEFYNWYAQTARGRGGSALSFELLDVTCQTDRLTIISPGDSDAFQALKVHMWTCFRRLARDAGLDALRVLVTSHCQRAVGERVSNRIKRG